MQGLKLQQISVLVAFLMAVAIVLLVADQCDRRRHLARACNHQAAGGLGLLVWLAIWTLGGLEASLSLGGVVSDHDDRPVWSVGDLCCRTGFLASCQAVHDYRIYTGCRSPARHIAAIAVEQAAELAIGARGLLRLLEEPQGRGRKPGVRGHDVPGACR